nr:RecName: Full=Peroxidase 4 [Capsicum annuum]
EMVALSGSHTIGQAR